MTTATQAALTLIRNENTTLEQLARYFGESEAFAAGVVESVTGDQDWAHAQRADGIEPSESERADYQRGFAAGLALVEVEAEADGWQEAYTLAAAEAQQAAALLPVVADGIPW